jgi:hypothetical protein
MGRSASGGRSLTAQPSQPGADGFALPPHQGSFALSDGATLVTTTGLTNDSFYYGSDFSDDGGSTLKAASVLTNSAQINIGNTNLLASTPITAAGLTNSGTINLTGASAVRAKPRQHHGSPATWTGTANLSGDALLEFASGGITGTVSGPTLR